MEEGCHITPVVLYYICMNHLTINKTNNLKPTGNNIYDTYIRDFNNFLNNRKLNIDIIKEYIELCKGIYKPSTIGCIKSALKKSLLRLLHF